MESLAYCSPWGNKKSDMTERLKGISTKGRKHTLNKQRYRNYRGVWSYDKRFGICVTGFSGGEEKKGKVKKLLKEISPKSSQTLKDMHVQIQEARQIPKIIYSKKSSKIHHSQTS